MGTYGRFNAHNARVKQLKHEKTKRYKNIRFAIRESSSQNNSFNKVDNKTLEKIKEDIKTKAKKKKHIDTIFNFILTVFALCFICLFVNWIMNL